MKKKFLTLTLAILTCFLAAGEKEIDPRLLENPLLGHYLSVEEIFSDIDLSRDFYETDPPIPPVKNIAEFEQMEGVLISYNPDPPYYGFGISYDIISEISEDIIVTTIVHSNSDLLIVINLFNNNSVNLDNCNFLIAPSDSYWTRDYGPWYIMDSNNEIAIVNFPYNRPRPNDNDIPIEMAEFLDIQLYGMNVIHTGGNYMTDGMGIGASSTLVYNENSIPDTLVNQRMCDYLGIHTYHTLEDPLGEYIEHIDCWGKFLDVDKILIGEVPPSDPRYNDYEAVADYFATTDCSYGYPYQVYRVYEPNDQPYTNSLILNKKVLVPIVNSSWDDDALAVYEEAMPGYEIMGFTGSWLSTDALHCRSKGIPDREMLYISHIPHYPYAVTGSDYEIQAEIIPLSGASLVTDSLMIYYSTDGENYSTVNMTLDEENTYFALIPEQPAGSEISYYLYAADENGNRANHPFIGYPDPHLFWSGAPDIMLESDSIDIEIEAGNNLQDLFTIYNEGYFDLEIDIDYQASGRDLFEYEIPNSPFPYTYDSNTYDELGWTDFYVEENLTVNEWTINYHWSTDNWPEEGSFMVESPSGTVFVIGAGEEYGDYTKSTSSFQGESMQGNWKLWIEDSYGDGGHRATNITMSITDLPPEEAWLTVEPITAVIEPENSININYTCNALELEVGDYLGIINISSNDPDEELVTFTINLTVTPGVGNNHSEFPEITRLTGNHPNPFNPSTKIEYQLAETNRIELSIYNIRGQLVKTLVKETKSAGIYSQTWNGRDSNDKQVDSGIYFYRLKTDSTNQIRKMILLK